MLELAASLVPLMEMSSRALCRTVVAYRVCVCVCVRVCHSVSDVQMAGKLPQNVFIRYE